MLSDMMLNTILQMLNRLLFLQARVLGASFFYKRIRALDVFRLRPLYLEPLLRFEFLLSTFPLNRLPLGFAAIPLWIQQSLVLVLKKFHSLNHRTIHYHCVSLLRLAYMLSISRLVFCSVLPTIVTSHHYGHCHRNYLLILYVLSLFYWDDRDYYYYHPFLSQYIQVIYPGF